MNFPWHLEIVDRVVIDEDVSKTDNEDPYFITVVLKKFSNSSTDIGARSFNRGTRQINCYADGPIQDGDTVRVIETGSKPYNGKRVNGIIIKKATHFEILEFRKRSHR